MEFSLTKKKETKGTVVYEADKDDAPIKTVYVTKAGVKVLRFLLSRLSCPLGIPLTRPAGAQAQAANQVGSGSCRVGAAQEEDAPGCLG